MNDYTSGSPIECKRSYSMTSNDFKYLKFIATNGSHNISGTFLILQSFLVLFVLVLLFSILDVLGSLMMPCSIYLLSSILTKPRLHFDPTSFQKNYVPLFDSLLCCQLVWLTQVFPVS